MSAGLDDIKPSRPFVVTPWYALGKLLLIGGLIGGGLFLVAAGLWGHR